MVVSFYPESLTLVEIVNYCGISHYSVLRQTQELVNKGHLVRKYRNVRTAYFSPPSCVAGAPMSHAENLREWTESSSQALMVTTYPNSEDAGKKNVSISGRKLPARVISRDGKVTGSTTVEVSPDHLFRATRALVLDPGKSSRKHFLNRLPQPKHAGHSHGIVAADARPRSSRTASDRDRICYLTKEAKRAWGRSEEKRHRLCPAVAMAIRKDLLCWTDRENAEELLQQLRPRLPEGFRAYVDLASLHADEYDRAKIASGYWHSIWIEYAGEPVPA